MLTVLVVDDEQALLQLVADELRDAGYSVRTAPNGRAGLQSAIDLTPDIIITDIAMPELNGYDMLEALWRESPVTSAIPFILMSGLRDRRHAVGSVGIGEHNFVPKPIDFEILRGMMTTMLDGGEADNKISASG